MREKKEVSDEESVVIEKDVNSDDSLAKIKKTLKECEVLKKEYLNGWQREKADAQNQKKLHRQRLAEENERSLAMYTLSILPIVDSVRAAKLQFEKDTKDTTAKNGLEQIYTQCIQSLKSINVTLIDTVGEAFDPQKHEAIGEKTVETKEQDGKVIEIVRVGASVGDVLARAAMVYVGKYKV